MKKKKYRTWQELQENKCPKCNNDLQEGMFNEIEGCSCGFVIEKKTKELLVNRDKENE